MGYNFTKPYTETICRDCGQVFINETGRRKKCFACVLKLRNKVWREWAKIHQEPKLPKKTDLI